ncbi:DUF4013 domain-containing protein [bacterium]|nr:DUF4013 domain-containing protein [bacterium]
MAVSTRSAFKNIFKDKDFLSKYSVLVVLTFAMGLMTFIMVAKNYDLLPIAIPLYFLAMIFDYGYHLKYIQNLMNDENALLPDWSKPGDIFITGIKFITAILMLAMPIIAVFLVLLVSVAMLSTVSKAFLVLLIIPFFLFAIVEIVLILAGPGFLFAYLEQNEDLFALYNLKKVFSYFSINYFTALFAILSLSVILGFMGSCTMVSLKYALFYIIPLLLAPIFRLSFNNLIGQAYCANKRDEKGSALALFGYIGEFILLLITYFIIVIILSIKFG